MPAVKYAISYNNEEHILEFRYQSSYDAFDDSTELPRICTLVFKQMLDLNNMLIKPVEYRASFGYDGIVYGDDIAANEKITDTLFLHGEYGQYEKRPPSFLVREDFESWQTAIQGANKDLILDKLWIANKISVEYFTQHRFGREAECANAATITESTTNQLSHTM